MFFEYYFGVLCLLYMESLECFVGVFYYNLMKKLEMGRNDYLFVFFLCVL